MTEYEITVSGPFFDQRWNVAMDRLITDSEDVVADQAFADWHTNLNRSIRHPTPYYETQIRRHREDNAAVADDRGVIYGPWLEGVGSRNSPKTRFPGYFSLRRAVQSTEARVQELVKHVIEKFVIEINEE